MCTKFLLIRYSILRNILNWSYMIYFVYEISTIYNENIFLCILWYNIRLIEVNLTCIYDHKSLDDRSFKLWIHASPRRFLYVTNYYLLYDKYKLYPLDIIQLIIAKTRSYVVMYCLNTFYVFMFIGSGLSHKQYF